MAEIPNLTDKLAELREHKGAKSLGHRPWTVPEVKKPDPGRRKGSGPERRIAPNPLTRIVYGLAALALAVQLILVFVLDIL